MLCQLNFIMLQDGHWQGYFIYDSIIYPMTFKQTHIQVNPPGTFTCAGSDQFGTFKMQGSFYMTYCIITKTYQEEEGHFFLYIGEVFYPPEMKRNPLPEDQNKIIQFNRRIKEEEDKARLLLFKEYTLKHSPKKRVMIRGFYQTPQKIYGNIFWLTFIPNSQINQQSTQQAGNRQVDQELKMRAQQLAYIVKAKFSCFKIFSESSKSS